MCSMSCSQSLGQFVLAVLALSCDCGSCIASCLWSSHHIVLAVIMSHRACSHHIASCLRLLRHIVLVVVMSHYAHCNAPSGALGSPTWTCGVTQGNSEGTGFSEDLSVQDSGEGSKVKGEV
jgi:hypothetical protein